MVFLMTSFLLAFHQYPTSIPLLPHSCYMPCQLNFLTRTIRILGVAILLLCIYKQKNPLIKINNFLEFFTVIRVNTLHGMLPFHSQFKCSHIHVGIVDHREIRNAKTERFSEAWQLQRSRANKAWWALQY
jgi:hypothetical protein